MKRFRYFIPLCAAFLLASGCVTETFEKSLDNVPVDGGSALSFFVKGEVDSDEDDTKTILKTWTANKINNLNIWVYDSDGNIVDASKERTYFTSSSMTLTYIPASTLPYSIYALANMGYIEAPATISGLAAVSYEIEDFSSLSTNGFPAAVCITDYIAGTSMSGIGMDRLVAKYNISFKADDAHLIYDIRYTAIRRANKVLRPFADVLGAGDGSFSCAAQSVDETMDGDYSRIGYRIRSGSDTRTLTFYTTENCQGSISGNTNIYNKVPANSEKDSLCTYIELRAKVTDLANEYIYPNVVFRYYLGCDEYNDFNVRRNTEYNWEYDLSLSEFTETEDEWFREGDGYPSSINLWFTTYPEGTVEEQIDSVYMANFITTTIYARTDNPLIDWGVTLDKTKDFASTVTMTVTDVDETTKKIVLNTTAEQTSAAGTWDPRKSWAENPYNSIPITIASKSSDVKASAVLDARLVRSVLGIDLINTRGDEGLYYGDNKSYDVFPTIADPFGLYFKDNTSSFSMKGYRKYWHKTWLGYSKEVAKKTRTTDPVTTDIMIYEPNYSSRVFALTQSHLPILQHSLNSDLVKKQRRYCKPTCYLSWSIGKTCLACNVVKGISGEYSQKRALIEATGVDPSKALNVPGGAHRYYPTQIKVYPYLYDVSGEFAVGSLSGTRRSQCGTTKSLLEKIKGTIYYCYTPVSGKSPMFKLLSSTFDAYMQTESEINDRTFPAIWIKSPDGTFYKRNFNHIESWDVDNCNYTFYFEDNCTKIEHDYLNESQEESSTDNGDDEDEDEDLDDELKNKKVHRHHKQYEHGIWSTKNVNTIRKSYDAPYVWPFENCPATFTVKGTKYKKGDTFTVKMP